MQDRFCKPQFITDGIRNGSGTRVANKMSSATFSKEIGKKTNSFWVVGSTILGQKRGQQ